MTLITRARVQDAKALRLVFFQAVRIGATKYTPAQRAAWAPDARVTRAWVHKLAVQEVWVARSCRGPVGFMTLRPDGYLNMAFVLPTARGRGIFRRLFECCTKHRAAQEVFTHASLHAQPAFAAVGFEMRGAETLVRFGQRLRRARMVRPGRPRATCNH